MRALSAERDRLALALESLESQIDHPPSAREIPARDWKSVAREIGAVFGSQRRPAEASLQDRSDDGPTEGGGRGSGRVSIGFMLVIAQRSAVLARPQTSHAKTLLWSMAGFVLLAGVSLLVASYRKVMEGSEEAGLGAFLAAAIAVRIAGVLLVLVVTVSLARWLIP